MKKLLIVGAGGHAKVVIEAALQSSKYDDFYLIDDKYKLDRDYKILNKWPLVGSTKDIFNPLIKKKFKNAFVAIGDNNSRISFLNCLKKEGYSIPNIIHPSSIISPSAKINYGSAILSNAVINAETFIGFGSIINTSSNIDHECIIKEGVHICPGVNVAGNVEIGKLSFIGVGTSIKNGIKLGNQVIVGAGSAVISDLTNGVTAVGVPAKLI